MYCKACGEFMNDNQAICLKCGIEKGKGGSFCQNCGSPVPQEAVMCVNCGVALRKSDNTKNAGTTQGISSRNIVTAIILSIVTCGIYSIYWFVCLTNEINKASGKTSDINGGMAFLLSLLTCGVYTIYWAYKVGEKRDIIANENNSSKTLYLLLAIFAPTLVVYALAQDSLNKAIESNN